MERLIVKVGCGELEKPMTRSHRTVGRQNMPSDLRKAGFVVDVYRTDPVINGGDWFRGTTSSATEGLSCSMTNGRSFDRSLGGFDVFGSLIEDVFSWFCWWRH